MVSRLFFVAVPFGLANRAMSPGTNFTVQARIMTDRKSVAMQIVVTYSVPIKIRLQTTKVNVKGPWESGLSAVGLSAKCIALVAIPSSTIWPKGV